MDKIVLETPINNLTETRLASLEANQTLLLNSINSWTDVLNKILANSSQIYPQVDTAYDDNIIKIKADKTVLNSTALLYVLPSETLEDNVGTPELQVIHPSGETTTLRIMRLVASGGLEEITGGDIVSGRLCIFRFNPLDHSQVILENSPLHGDYNLDNIVVNNATFLNTPKVRQSVGGITSDIKVATQANIDELSAMLESDYQKKIIIGTLPPDEYAKKYGIEDGQLYLQIVAYTEG